MKCPNCNETLVTTEFIDYTNDLNERGVDEMWVDVAGHCPICSRKYLWTQRYTLTSEDNLEDDE